MKNLYSNLSFLFVFSIYACRQQEGSMSMQPFFNECGEAYLPEINSQDLCLESIIDKLSLSITNCTVKIDFEYLMRIEDRIHFNEFLKNLESIGIYPDPYIGYLGPAFSLGKDLDIVQGDITVKEKNEMIDWLDKIEFFEGNNALRLRNIFNRNCGSEDCSSCFKYMYSLYIGSSKVRDHYDIKNDVFAGGERIFLCNIISKYLVTQRVWRYDFGFLDRALDLIKPLEFSALEYLSAAKLCEMYNGNDSSDVELVFSEIENIKKGLLSNLECNILSEGRDLRNCDFRAHRYWLC